MIRPLLALALIAAPGIAHAADRSFLVGSFTRVRVDGPFAVTVRTGASPRATASGSNDALDALTIRVDGDTAVVTMGAGNWSSDSGRMITPPAVTLSTPALNSATVNAGATLTIDAMKGQKVDLALNGSGSISVGAITADLLNARIVGTGQMFVITLGPGNVDLSLPANIGLASAVAMKVMDGNDSLVAVGLLAALGAGLVIGVFNYLLIWALRIPPIIATLSASFIIQSIDISYGRGLQIKPPPGFAEFTDLQFFGIPVLAVLVMLFTVGAAILLQRMIYGRSVLAIGQNIRAAWLAGVKVGRIRFLTYALSGALGGLDGALLAGYFRGANVDIGNEYLLSSLAVVVKPIQRPSAESSRHSAPGGSAMGSGSTTCATKFADDSPFTPTS